MRTIVDSSKTSRRVVEHGDSVDPGRVRAAAEPESPVPLAELPEALAEIIGRAVATLRKLSRMGVPLAADEIDQLGALVKMVGTLATASGKVAKPAELTEAELERIANGG